MMMKKYISTIIFIFALTANILAQSPGMFSYQAILKDSNGDLLVRQEVTIDVSILLNTETGTEVFTESHTVTTTDNGLINLKIGSKEDLSVVNWGQGSHFLKISMNATVIENKELLTVPFSFNTKETAFTDSLSYNKLSNLPDFTNWDKNKNDEFDGNYSSFFMWSEENKNLFYNKGNVSIQGSETTDFQGEVLKVNGAILYNGVDIDTVAGVLYYDPSGNGSFRYFDNNKDMKVIGTGTINFNDPDPPAGDVVIVADAIWKPRVCIGKGGYPGYPFGENVFVLANDTLRIYFYDSSTTGTFPSSDWQIRLNDMHNGGDNYFAVFDTSSQNTPFKIMAGSPDNSLFIDTSYYIGIGNNQPTENLDVEGAASASYFIGDGSALSGLSGATASIENSGSTTIGADSDGDLAGQIEFQIKGATQLLIDNEGKVILGASVPSVEFDASGKDAEIQFVQVTDNLNYNKVYFSIYTETDPGATAVTYDVANKKNIIFDSSVGAITINGFKNGVAGQKITIVNKSASALVLKSFIGDQWILNPGFVNYTLNQYESASYVFNQYWICQELVKAP